MSQKFNRMLVLSLVSNAAWHQAVSWFEVCMLSLRGFPGLLPQSWTHVQLIGNSKLAMDTR